MHDMHLAGTDLNLLVVLCALVAEENVTRAGKRVGLSQSAMSHALARLRTTFDDPILVRAGGKMVATHRAKTLAVSVNEGLGILGRALEGGARFDPATSRRTFTIGMSDYVELVILPALLERLRVEGPRIDLWVVAADTDVPERLMREDLDLVIAPMRDADRVSGIMAEELFEEGFVCVMRTGHPLAGRPLTVARFATANHVLIAPRGLRGSYSDTALEKLGMSRRVMLGVPHFLVVPHLVARSDLIATLAERVAHAFAETHGLVLTKSPFPLERFVMSQIWHARHDSDEGHAWLRRMFREVAEQTAASPSKRRPKKR